MKTITPDTTTSTSQHQQLLIPQADHLQPQPLQQPHQQQQQPHQSLVASAPAPLIMEHVNLVDDDERDPLALEQPPDASATTKHTHSLR